MGVLSFSLCFPFFIPRLPVLPRFPSQKKRETIDLPPPKQSVSTPLGVEAGAARVLVATAASNGKTWVRKNGGTKLPSMIIYGNLWLLFSEVF